MKSQSENRGIGPSLRVGIWGYWRISLVLIALLLGSGCARTAQLAPAPEANRVAGEENSAVAEVAGVRAVVNGNTWSGEPANLEDQFTPIQVTIENHSGRPLRVRYNEFALVSASGFHYAALPPYKIEGSVVTLAATRPFFPYTGFHVAPYYRMATPYWAPWDGPFAFDSIYYGRYYPLWRVPLPTEDMLRKAIAEGALDDGGSLSGFLYFQRVGGNVNRVNFNFDLVDARTGETFGTIRIPFIVK